MTSKREERRKIAASLLLAKPSTERSIVPTIDTLRGIMFVMVFHIHFLSSWHGMDWASLARIIFYTTDFVPVMFITLSIVGNMVQIAIAREKQTSRRQSHRRIYRAAFLVLFAELLNLFTVGQLGPYCLVVWNIVLTIAIITFLLPSILKLKPWIRVALALIIAVAYFPLQSALATHATGLPIDLTLLHPANLQDPLVFVYFALFYQGMMTPIFSCLIVPLLATIVFEPFATAIATRQRDLPRLGKTVQWIEIAGLILVVAGVITGIARVPDSFNGSYAELFMDGPYFTWPFHDGIFLFLIRHTPQYIIYDLGITLVLFGVLAHFQVVRGLRFRGEDTLNILGRLSLSGFMYSFIAFWIPLTLDLPTIYIIIIPLLIIIIAAFRVWYTRLCRIGTYEWMMDVHTNTILYFLDRRDKLHVRH